MENVMTRAWQIARLGQMRFGGSVKEYFAVSLKMAWTEVKTTQNNATLVTKQGSRNHKSWVAELTGTDKKYGYNRKFVEDFKEDYPERIYTLIDGYYDVCDAGDRKYIKVSNGQIETIEKTDIVFVA